MKAISAFVGNRLFEWITSGVLLGLSLEMLFWPRVLKSGAFHYLYFAGDVWPAFIYLIVAYSRMIALVINGRSLKYGPIARAVGGLAGAMLWAQMDVALMKLVLERNDLIPFGIPVYLGLTLGELLTVYRAMADVVRDRS